MLTIVISTIAPNPDNTSPIRLNKILINNLNLIIFWRYSKNNKQKMIVEELNFAVLNIHRIICMIITL